VTAEALRATSRRTLAAPLDLARMARLDAATADENP
jgi:hypothetical protein